jgi:hypothetical protein
MSTSRRSFVKSGIVVGLVAAAGFNLKNLVSAQERTPGVASSATITSVPEEAKTDDVFYFKKSTFESYLNTEFVVRLGATTTTMKLVQIVDCSTSLSDKSVTVSKGECFALIFKANRKFPKSIPILPLEHAALGRFELFLETAKNMDDPKGIYYQAVINHSQP